MPRFVFTPADEPISEASAHVQIAAEWGNAQHELAMLIATLPAVTTPLFDDRWASVDALTLLRLRDDARSLSTHVGSLVYALDNAVEIMDRVKVEKPDD